MRLALRKGAQLALLPARGGVMRWQHPGGADPTAPPQRPPLPEGDHHFERLMGDLHRGSGAVHLRDHTEPHVQAAARHGLIRVHKTSSNLKRDASWGSSYTHHAALTDKGRAWMERRSAQREAEHQSRQGGLFKGRRSLLLMLRKAAQQLALFGGGPTQAVHVKGHMRRTKSGKAVAVKEHEETRRKAEEKPEPPPRPAPKPEPVQAEAFNVGDSVIFDGAVGEVEVNYRGRVGDKATVIMPGGMQITVPADKLRRKPPEAPKVVAPKVEAPPPFELEAESKDGGTRRVHVDVGEKIEGSRKDKWAGRRATSDDLGAMEETGDAVKHVTKAAFLVPLNVDDERANGATAGCVQLKKALLNSMGNMPGHTPSAPGSSPAGRVRFVRAIEDVQRDLDRCKTVDDVMELVEDWKHMALGGVVRAERLTLAEAVARFKPEHLTDGRGGTGSGFRLGDYWFDSSALSRAGFDDVKPLRSKGALLLYRKPGESDAKATGIPAGESDYERKAWLRTRWEHNVAVLGNRFEGIVRGFGKTTRPTFHTKELRAAQAREAGDDWTGLTKKAAPKAKHKVEPMTRGREKAVRRIGGVQVDLGTQGDYIVDTFGIRGIQHGDWVNDAQREAHLKATAEALHDLSDLMGVEPKALTHGGKLGIAFGARGSSGALAHYESDEVVINLTKTSGSGSLAHEWGHFLDHALTFKPGEGVGDNRRPALSGDPKIDANAFAGLSNGHRDHEVNPEVADAMSAVMAAIKRGYHDPQHAKLSRVADHAARERRTAWDEGRKAAWAGGTNGRSFSGSPEHREHQRRISETGAAEHEARQAERDYLRSKGLPTASASSFYKDASAMGDYWKRDHELFARSFETWVQSRLEARGRANSYLTADTKGTKPVKRTRKGVQHEFHIYPQGKEAEAVWSAIDDLVATIGRTGALRKALALLGRRRRRLVLLFKAKAVDPRQMGMFGAAPFSAPKPAAPKPAAAAPHGPPSSHGQQLVSVKAHPRRSKTGAVAVVTQHEAHRAKAAEPEESNAQRAARMRAERTARDKDGEAKRQAWAAETAKRLVGTENYWGDGTLDEKDAEHEANKQSHNMRWSHDYDVAADKLPALRERIEKLNKRAAKLGVDPIRLEVSPEGETRRAWILWDHQGKRSVTENEKVGLSAKDAREVVWQVHHVHIEGETPRLPDHTFLAKIEHNEGGNIVKGMHPKVGAIPHEYLTVGKHCEHCGFVRDRKHTYLVLDEKHHNVTQVGKTCLKDFIGGHADPEKVAAAAEWASDLDFTDLAGGGDYDDGDGDGGGGDPSGAHSNTSIRYYLAHVAEAYIRDGGYVSRKAAAFKDGMSTGGHADLRAFPGRKKPPAPVSETARQIAKEVEAWGDKLAVDQAAKPEPGFRWNLGVLFRQGYARAQDRGLLAAAVSAWERDTGATPPSGADGRKRKKPEDSEHIGTVGERSTHTLYIDKMIPYESEYGEGTIYAMTDDQGNRVKWSTSAEPGVLDDPRSRPVVGKPYTVTFAVKRHGAYKGAKETQITRPVWEARADGIRHDQHTGAVIKGTEHADLREGLEHYKANHPHPDAKVGGQAVAHHLRSALHPSQIEESDEDAPILVHAGRGKGALYIAGGAYARPAENPEHGHPGEHYNTHLLRAVEHMASDKKIPGHKMAKRIAPQIREAVERYQEGINVPLPADLARPLRKGKSGPVQLAQVRGKGKPVPVRKLELPAQGRAQGAPPEEPASQARPPTSKVKYRHPESGKVRIAHVTAGGEKGITALDEETGQQLKLHHGHYTAHDSDEEAWDGKDSEDA